MVVVEESRPAPAGDIDGTPPQTRTRTKSIVTTIVAVALLAAALSPSLRAGFWSWDWYWIDEHARGNTAWGGPFYDVANHANPLPVEVQWYRATLELLGLNPFAHHLLTLTGLIATLGVLYLVTRRLGVPPWACLWAVVLAGLAPSSLTSWTWFAASPHMWAALLGLGAAAAHLAWRRGGSRCLPLALAAPLLSVIGLAVKNDAVIGPLLILAWEWSGGRRERPAGRVIVTAAAVVPMMVFVWWQATAIDPHRDQAQTGVWQVLGKTFGLLRFAFLWQDDAELRAEFPPASPAPVALVVAGAAVGAAVLALAIGSLWTRSGRVLVAAGLASLGPVAVLEPALLSRYVLPPVLLITAAAGAGAAHLIGRIGRNRPVKGGDRRAAVVGPRVLAGAAVATLAIWGTLAHLAGAGGAVATREEEALLAGLLRAGLSAQDRYAVRLVGSPIEPSTAAFRQYDPDLPAAQRLRGLRFLLPGEAVPAGMPLATVTRLPDGTYVVDLD